MPIDFSCLNCRHRLSVDDDVSGELIDCPECRTTLKVPVPLGGRLTEKRIAGALPPPLLEPNQLRQRMGTEAAPRDGGNAAEAARQHRAVNVPHEPHSGFMLDFGYDCVLARQEEVAADEALHMLIEKLLQHFQERSKEFQSAGLLLIVFAFTGDEVIVQMKGSVNGEPVRVDARLKPGAITLQDVLALRVFRTLFPKDSGYSSVSVFAERVGEQLLYRFRRALDNHVGRSAPWWQFW